MGCLKLIIQKLPKVWLLAIVLCPLMNRKSNLRIVNGNICSLPPNHTKPSPLRFRQEKWTNKITNFGIFGTKIPKNSFCNLHLRFHKMKSEEAEVHLNLEIQECLQCQVVWVLCPHLHPNLHLFHLLLQTCRNKRSFFTAKKKKKKKKKHFFNQKKKKKKKKKK